MIMRMWNVSAEYEYATKYSSCKRIFPFHFWKLGENVCFYCDRNTMAKIPPLKFVKNQRKSAVLDCDIFVTNNHQLIWPGRTA